MRDAVYLDRVEAFLCECLEVAERDEPDIYLEREIRLELAALTGRTGFPVIRLRMHAPGKSPEAAALALYRLLIYRSIAARDLAESRS